MRQAIGAEWVKLRTTPGTAWWLLGTVAVTVALSALAAVAAGGCSPGSSASGCGDDPIDTSLTGVQLGQVVVAILAVQTFGSEHSCGMIRTTLVAVPRRLEVLAAKLVVSSGVVVVAGLASVAGALVVGRLLLPEWLPLSLTDGATLRAGAASVLYLGLIGAISLGVAAALRDSGAAIGAVLGLLFLFPVLRLAVTDPGWQRRIDQISPSNAGFAVLTAWAAAALVAGGLLLQRRDP